MSFKTIVNNSRTWWAHASAHGAYRIRLAFHARPLASASVLVAAGLLIGVAGRSAAGMAQVSLLQAKAEQDPSVLKGGAGEPAAPEAPADEPAAAGDEAAEEAAPAAAEETTEA